MILLYTFSFARGQELLYYKTAKHTFRIVTMTVVCICVVTSPQTAVMTIVTPWTTGCTLAAVNTMRLRQDGRHFPDGIFK